jgi:hypothetical protein
METSSRRSYTKEQRAAAVADVPALGEARSAAATIADSDCSVSTA